jgi:hypothetical protein
VHDDYLARLASEAGASVAKILACAVIHRGCEAIATEGREVRCQSAPISKTLCRHPARRFTRHAAARSIDDAGDMTREVRGKHVPAIRQRCMGGQAMAA